MADATPRFCVEDTVGSKDDRYQVGVVDRSFSDVDSHEPRPERDYAPLTIDRHAHVPRDHFTKFMKTGIPPRGTVLVSWQTQVKIELVPEARLELLDRALLVGDVVKRDTKDHMSGTVIGTNMSVSLFPATKFDVMAPPTPSVTEEFAIKDVPAEELINVHEYTEGALVIYDDWVGRIEDVFEMITIQLANNSVVTVENADDLEPDDKAADRLSVGDTVKTKKGNLRRGNWRYGAFDPNVRPHGIVVETRVISISVQWLTKRLGRISGLGNEPDSHLEIELIQDKPNFKIYDASRSAVESLPVTADGPAYHVAELIVGDRVRFKDLPGAAVKYDGSRVLEDGSPQGKLSRIPRTETLGYDMNVYLVMQTHSTITVQWQDLSVTNHLSTCLVPDSIVEDEDEVWPGEIICTKEQSTQKTPNMEWTFEPARVGVVQTVNSRDRIATVRWFDSASIRFYGDDLIPPVGLGKISAISEEVSLYDIRSTPSLTRRRGDFVIVHETEDINSVAQVPGSAAGGSPNSAAGPLWFGEVVDLGLDGWITVRMGAAKPVIDFRIPVEKVTLVYSTDMQNDVDLMEPLEGDSVDDSEDDSLFSEEFNEMWVEYEGMDGEPIGETNEEDWSTEDEQDDSDDSMPDLEDPDIVDTSKTTPEAHSDGERHKSPTSASSSTHLDTASPVIDDPPHSLPGDAMDVDCPTEHVAPSPFLVLDTPIPTDHNYFSTPPSLAPTLTRRIAREHKILRSSLPPGIFVRTWENRLDLLRVMMIGPTDTPYEYAPFVIDFHLPPTFPAMPPSAYFHSWTYGNGPVNPNLYEDGKICLSLLGTWHADERNESWSAGKSTLLQVLVSIMGLVLVRDPYYNEAGYEGLREAPETKLNSALYTERAYFRARGFIVHALSKKVPPFLPEIHWLYLAETDGAPRLLDKAITAAAEVLERSQREDEEGERDGLRRISKGAVVMLRRQVEKLRALKGRS
ncbi:hypothetical protein P154DRAFT_559666 [Amniculicola lignicola CBS 123094]|uniref:UBC core domain-containing protein n=1 Tax=Amniculicola lignicola CBS 123094 TaxID=1392246 RepID=A0A6A5X0G1_9PLEO|nr:hypothetical protein P154DRAFT_559666 [Amniculicola lignicola CBS 123094]